MRVGIDYRGAPKLHRDAEYLTLWQTVRCAVDIQDKLMSLAPDIEFTEISHGQVACYTFEKWNTFISQL